MEHKKDIGELVEETMAQGMKTPQPSLWERLDASLEARAKKRRRALWLWFGGSAILLLLLLGVWGLATNGTLRTIVHPKMATEVTTKVETMQNATQTNSPITEADGYENGRPIDELDNNNDNTNNSVTTEHTDARTENETGSMRRKKISAENPITDTTNKNGFTVTTTHEYYNSDLDTTVASTNKRKIDSLVRVTERKMAIIDSIARARATDSIKLNEARKDSIPNKD
ncbi:MAG TPA: hypothetical protein EYN07_09620 [Flavobacteriaceae bacterium]|nr:hypothetical protein [Flavobacteriaceae bacterium]HIN99485.1 hypothetical protein [Flavobacteriaceae bacterium]